MPAGYIRDKEKSKNQWLIKVGEHYDSIQNLEEMLLCKLPGVGNVRMSDVADITVIDNAGETYAKSNGEEGVLLSIFKGSTASTSDVAKTCEAAIAKLEEDYEGLTVTPIMNQGDYITMFISSILQSMIGGALLAVLVLVMFFKDAKPTLVVAFSIPFSVLFAILIMYFSDISINIMTLAGLGLAIGMLVDNSIVVIENIYRIRNHGVSAPRAAVQGAKQVAGPIISSTLTTVCVFLPMVFTTGLVAELMVPFAMTITYALTASLIVALSIVPTAGSILLKNTKEKRYPLFEKVQKLYGKALSFSLRFKIVPLVLSVLLLVICIREVMRMGITMLPEMTGEQISISVSVPEETENFSDLVTLRERGDKEEYTLTDAGAAISEKTAKMLGAEPGDTIDLQIEDGISGQVTIGRICENYMSHYLYMTPEAFADAFGENADCSDSLVIFQEEYRADPEQVGRDIMDSPAALSISYTGSIADQLENMLSSLDSVIVVLIVSAGMLAFVVLYNLNNINITERKRELATLKVLGFFDGEVSAYVFRENVLLTLIGAAFGALLGIVLHRFVIVTVEVDAAMFGRNIYWPSFLYSVLFTIGFSAFVNLTMHFKLKKIDMVESLKSVE